MTNQITVINNHDLAVKEIGGQKVVTFRDIDTIHEKAEGTVKRNFNENKKYFIEGEDFYALKPADFQKGEIRTLGIERSDVPNRGKIYLTQMGYLMIAKSLAGDLAWHIQRQLVNSYFLNKTASETQIVTIEQFQSMQKSISDLATNISFIKSEIFKLTTSPKNSEWKRKINAKLTELNEITNIPRSSLLEQVFSKMKKNGCDLLKLIHQYEFENNLSLPCPTTEYIDRHDDVKYQFETLLDELIETIAKNPNYKHNGVETTRKYVVEKQKEEILPIKINEPVQIDLKVAIQPLIEKYADSSVGGNSTYRKVYAAMGVSWLPRQTRYKNEHNLKKSPKKMTLIENDAKLMKLFIKTVNELLENKEK